MEDVEDVVQGVPFCQTGAEECIYEIFGVHHGFLVRFEGADDVAGTGVDMAKPKESLEV